MIDGMTRNPQRQLMNVRCTVVIDNTSTRTDLRTEHGLCLHIQSAGQVLLLDAGKSNQLLGNLGKLGLDSIPPQWIVLSHGHYDHITGVPALLGKFPDAKLHFHPCLLEPKWILDAPGQWRYAGVLQSFSRLEPYLLPAFRASMELISGVWTSGSVMGDEATTFENGKFFRNPRGNLIADAFPDEQVLVVQGQKGISIVSGCCHAGVIRTIAKVRELFPQEPFDAFVGGLHLEGKSRAQMQELTQFMLAEGFGRIMPLHCSGTPYAVFLAEEYPQLYLPGGAGAMIEL